MPLETGSYINDLVASNPPGTDAKAQGDDHLRLIKNALKNCFAGFTGAIIVTGTDGGAVNAYTLTPTPALIGYTTRMIALFSPTITNTGAATINISGLGTRPIVSVSNAALVSGDLQVGTIYAAAYDGTSFRLLSITKNYADQLAFSSTLPAQAGNAGKFLQTNGITASWQQATAVTVASRGSNIALDESNRGNLIIATASFTQTITAAANLLAGWFCYYLNSSSANVTFDPNASEPIDGSPTGILEPGMMIQIVFNGAGFDCFRIGPPIMKILTSGTSGTWPLGVRLVDSEQVGGGGGGGRISATGQGAGANSGAAAKKQWIVSPNTGYTYAIGANGVGATVLGNAGTAGGATTLTYNAFTVTANGGAGGPAAGGVNGPRQTATNGDLNFSSGLGYEAELGGAGTETSHGGSPALGFGEGGKSTHAPTGLGAGGAGGSNSVNGQNGLPGGILLRY